MAAVVSRAGRVVPVGFWASFIHSQGMSIQNCAIQRMDGVFGFLSIRHFDEGKSARLAGITVEHHRDRFDFSIGAERRPKRLFRHFEIQIANEDVDHRLTGGKRKRRPNSGPPFGNLRGANVFCLPALGALGHVKLDGLTFLQAAESARLDG